MGYELESPALSQPEPLAIGLPHQLARRSENVRRWAPTMPPALRHLGPPATFAAMARDDGPKECAGVVRQTGRPRDDNGRGRRLRNEDHEVSGRSTIREAMVFKPPASQPFSAVATSLTDPMVIARSARASASCAATLDWKSFTCRRSSFASPCIRSMAPGSSGGVTDRRADACGNGFPQDAIALQRPGAAEERDSRAATESLGRAHDDRAYRSGLRHMRAAAGRKIEVLDVNEAQRAFALRFFAQRRMTLRLLGPRSGS